MGKIMEQDKSTNTRDENSSRSFAGDIEENSPRGSLATTKIIAPASGSFDKIMESINSSLRTKDLVVPELIDALSDDKNEGKGQPPPIDVILNALKPIEIDLLADLKRAGAKMGLDRYNLYDYDGLLEKGTRYLSRAVSLRDDAKEYTNRHTNDVIQRYQLFKDVESAADELAADGPIQKDIDGLSRRIAGFQAAISELDSSQSATDKAERRRLEGEVGQAQASLDARQASKKISISRLATLGEILRFRNGRAKTEGGALNYKDRVDELRTSFRKNMFEAYWALNAASVSIGRVFSDIYALPGTETEFRLKPFPNIETETTGIGYTEKLFDWVRHASAVLERRSRYQVEFRAVVDIGLQGYDKIVTANKGGKIEFEVGGKIFENLFDQKDLFDGLSDLRLDRIRIFFVTSDIPGAGSFKTIDVVDNLGTYVGTLTPDTNKNPGVPTYRFGDLAAIHSYWQDTPHVQPFRNCDPRGKWTLEISSEHTVHYQQEPGGGEPLDRHTYPNGPWINHLIAEIHVTAIEGDPYVG